MLSIWNMPFFFRLKSSHHFPPVLEKNPGCSVLVFGRPDYPTNRWPPAVGAHPAPAGPPGPSVRDRYDRPYRRVTNWKHPGFRTKCVVSLAKVPLEISQCLRFWFFKDFFGWNSRSRRKCRTRKSTKVVENSCSLDQGVHEMRNSFEEWRGNEVQKHVGIYQYECRCAYTSMLIVT